MTTSRDELLYETKLRDLIRKAIPVVLDRQEKKNYLAEQEEKKLRSLIRKLITETEVSEPEESPHKSTGINILEDLLKKIIPIIEIDFKKLTTEDIQRISFRAHILQAVENTLAPARITDRAVMKEQEDINVSVDDPEEFIDVRGETDKQDSWEILYSDEDKELFYDYLITNLKLYFDKFEDELKANLPEPTTPEYEKEVSSHAGGGEDDELGLGI